MQLVCGDVGARFPEIVKVRKEGYLADHAAALERLDGLMLVPGASLLVVVVWTLRRPTAFSANDLLVRT